MLIPLSHQGLKLLSVLFSLIPLVWTSFSQSNVATGAPALISISGSRIEKEIQEEGAKGTCQQYFNVVFLKLPGSTVFVDHWCEFSCKLAMCPVKNQRFYFIGRRREQTLRQKTSCLCAVFLWARATLGLQESSILKQAGRMACLPCCSFVMPMFI